MLRIENERMKAYLSENGIEASVKYTWVGSMKGTWYLYGKGQKWTEELREKLTGLGFLDFDSRQLSEYSGNGGTFSVSVRGHKEFIDGVVPIKR